LGEVELKNLEKLLIENPVIAAIRNELDLKKVVQSNALIVFVLYGSIINLKKYVRILRMRAK